MTPVWVYGGRWRASCSLALLLWGTAGSNIDGGCRTLSGTSVASPVVAGATALVASVIPAADRPRLLNPGSMKQAMIEGADRLPRLHIHEQGAGKINPVKSAEVLSKYQPRASIVPASIDLTDCPYMWPYCEMPLYAAAQPVVFNATVLNGLGPVSRQLIGGPW